MTWMTVPGLQPQHCPRALQPQDYIRLSSRAPGRPQCRGVATSQQEDRGQRAGVGLAGIFSRYSERGDQRIDLLLIWPLAPSIDTRSQGIDNAQNDFVGSRRVMNQGRRGIERIKVPALVEGTIEQVNDRAWRPDLGVAGNEDPAALDGAAHGHAEAGMDHGRAVF